MAVRLSDNARDGYTVRWDVDEGATDELVTLYAVGAKDDVHNKAPQVNNGMAGVFYPDGFTGSSFIEIRDAEGNVLDSGTITIS